MNVFTLGIVYEIHDIVLCNRALDLSAHNRSHLAG